MLPVNYRPPSPHGKEIAISENVYNADPAAPLPRSAKQLPDNPDPVFKQCRDKESVTECGCNDHMRMSGVCV